MNCHKNDWAEERNILFRFSFINLLRRMLIFVALIIFALACVALFAWTQAANALTQDEIKQLEEEFGVSMVPFAKSTDSSFEEAYHVFYQSRDIGFTATKDSMTVEGARPSIQELIDRSNLPFRLVTDEDAIEIAKGMGLTLDSKNGFLIFPENNRLDLGYGEGSRKTLIVGIHHDREPALLMVAIGDQIKNKFLMIKNGRVVGQGLTPNAWVQTIDTLNVTTGEVIVFVTNVSSEGTIYINAINPVTGENKLHLEF